MKRIVGIVLACSIALFGIEAKNEENIDYTKIPSKETRDSVNHWLDGDFGLKPHNVNYILPFGKSNRVYRSYESGVHYKDIEAELQVSLKLSIGSNLFGLGEKYYLAYTHKAFWQIYTESSPFRETNYSPEAFVSFPVSDRYSMFQLRNIKLGLAHTSNGKSQTWDQSLYPHHYLDPNNESRSVNYTYIEATLQHHSIISDIRIWYRLPEGIDQDDNPDYVDYVGHSELKFNYFYNKHMFCLDTRYNISTGNGSVEGSYSYPLGDDIYIYAKAFTGYGESLIDYNHYITKFSIGFSFSR